MFDLENLSLGKKKGTVYGHETTFLYQTDACRHLLEETMKFEGMGVPFSLPCTDDQIVEAVIGIESQLIFIEAKKNMVHLAKQLSPLLKHHTRVVLIGHEDSISAMRAVKELGFYYLFWPLEKKEVAVFLHFLQKDQSYQTGPQDARSARRIAVVAVKGGSGCTMTSAELAHTLASESQQKVIIADHGYTGSAMHVMLGKRDLAKRSIAEASQTHQTLGSVLDMGGAQGQLTRINPQIDYLGFEGKSGSGEDMREYTNNVLDALRREANFIIEDFSASSNFYPNPEWLCTQASVVVLLIQPTLSSISEARNFVTQFQKQNENQPTPARLITVLNHCQPKPAIPRASIEKYLELELDLEFPYYRQCEDLLIKGKRFFDSKTPLARPFVNLARMILGKPLEKKFSFAKGLFEKKEAKQKKVKEKPGAKISFKGLKKAANE